MACDHNPHISVMGEPVIYEAGTKNEWFHCYKCGHKIDIGTLKKKEGVYASDERKIKKSVQSQRRS